MKSKLFEPIMIGNLQVPNRIVMPSMVTQYGESTGFVTQRQIDYYTERAKNRVGLLIVEAAAVSRGARILGKQINIYEDAYIPGLKKLAESVKKAGACCFIQIQHGGRQASSAYNNGLHNVAPSVIAKRNGELPRELNVEEIDRIIEDFAQAVRRAREAGFDGVELHFAHGYLIAQFLSPLTNKRTDRYGGDLISRARLGVEIVQRIRQRIGESYPVIARICGDEFIKGGLVLRDAQKIAAMLEEAGLNAINVSGGYTSSHEEGYLNCLVPASSVPMSIPRGRMLSLAEGVKKVVKVPVIAVSRLDDPELAEKVLNEGKADMIAMGRAFIADAAFAEKVYRKQYSDIRHCIACNTCMLKMFTESNLSCAVSAETGREAEFQIKPASRAKRVLIVGGGPAGMEAARVAALRGHKVTLVEKKPYLGGNMVPAAAVDFKRDISLFTKYLTNAVSKLGVEVRLNTQFDQGKILALKPDVVILATGALPQVPSGNRSNVTDAVSVLEGNAETGSNVVVVGGGMIGCEVAAFLAQKGKKVTIVEMRVADYSDTDGLALDMEPGFRRWLLFDLLPTLPVAVIGKSTYKEVTDEGVIVEDREGVRKLIAGDTIVFAIGLQCNNGLKSKLEGKVPELYEIGDCVKARKIIDAVAEAAQVARLI